VTIKSLKRRDSNPHPALAGLLSRSGGITATRPAPAGLLQKIHLRKNRIEVAVKSLRRRDSNPHPALAGLLSRSGGITATRPAVAGLLQKIHLRKSIIEVSVKSLKRRDSNPHPAWAGLLQIHNLKKQYKFKSFNSDIQLSKIIHRI